jgi:TRAP-type C4-dicarboxylate transport system substrate-binding protein
VFGSLEKGVVDGIMIPASAANAMKLYEVMHYWTICRIHTAYCSVNVCLDTFNKLSEDVQVILVEEGKKCGEVTTKNVEAVVMNSTGELKQSGMELYEVPAAERDRWRQACFALWQEEISKVGPAAEIIIAFVDEANKINP